MREIDFSQQVIIFMNRWFLNSFAIWVVVTLFGEVRGDYSSATFFLAGFIFSVVNSILKPIITILSLPMILVTLGLFTLVVNGFIVWISLAIAPNVSMSFWNAIISGALLSLLNYMISSVANERIKERKI